MVLTMMSKRETSTNEKLPRFVERSKMFRRYAISFVFALFFVATAHPAVAQTNPVVELPRSFCDFALNPENNAICCIDHEEDEAIILEKGFVEGGGKESVRKGIRVGSTPACVSFKKYKDKSYFIVGCTQDAHLHVIDAESFELVKRVAVVQSGVSWVTNSRNPEDPFVYYCFGGGHDSMTGAIDVRKMTDCGQAFNDSMDCMISADGKTAYRRGPWSPSGFESLRMTNSFEDKKPNFIRLFYDHNSTSQYLPDPFGELTIAGKAIFTKDLKRKVAQTDHQPVCFMTSKPFVICSSGRDRFGRSRSKKEEQKLFVVSTNTFNKVGAVVTLAKPEAAKQVPRGSRGSADFKNVQTKTRYLIDDRNERLIVAEGKRLKIVDFDAFEFPDEVLMRLPKSEFNLRVGQAAKLSLAPTNADVKIEIDDIPEGSKLESNSLSWTATADQVGSEKVSVRLKYKDVERQQIVRFNISQPSISLGNTFSKLKISPNGQDAVVWFSQNNSFHGMHHRGNETKVRNTLAFVDLNSGKVIKTREMPFAISAANVDSHYVYVASAETNFCQILSRKDLKKVKTLYAERTIKEIETDGKVCSLMEKSYKVPALKPVSAGSANEVIKRIWKLENKPNRNAKIFQAIDEDFQERYRRDAMRNHRGNNNMPRNRKSLPGISGSVVAWKKNEHRQVPGATHTSELTTDVGLDIYSDVSNGKVKTIKLSSKTNPQDRRSNRSSSDEVQFDVCKNSVVVLAGKELYQWDAGTMDRTDLPEALKVLDTKPKLISSNSSSKFPIKTTGGKKPFEYTLLSTFPGIDIDESGNVVIDGDALTKRCNDISMENLKRDASRMARNEITETMSKYEQEVRAPLEKLVKKSYPKLPVKVEVKFRVSGNEAQTAEGSMTLVVGIDKQGFLDMEEEKNKELEAMNVEREKKKARQRALAQQKLEGNSPETTPESVKQLNEKIETLEARLDMMSRQMNQIIKLLEEKK